MPSTTPKIQEQIGAKNQELSYETADKWGILPTDAVITKGETLFPRIDVDAEIEELNKLIPSGLLSFFASSFCFNAAAVSYTHLNMLCLLYIA